MCVCILIAGRVLSARAQVAVDASPTALAAIPVCVNAPSGHRGKYNNILPLASHPLDPLQMAGAKGQLPCIPGV